MDIAIIGAGWYGVHIALVLSRLGHKVKLFEKNNDIFFGVSGNFGIRLHKGPHYPRSTATRESCHQTSDRFYKTYPELVVPHDYAIYALGRTDALGLPSRVAKSVFRDVCMESEECKEVAADELGYTNLELVMKLDEPSIVLGVRLRAYFRKKLEDEKIAVYCNVEIQEIDSIDSRVSLHSNLGMELFDKVINATGFQSRIPPRLKEGFPIDMEVVYQPCLALCYQDLHPSEKPISFIVMDGWYPCLMPYVDTEPFENRYIMTHGCYTILASCDTPAKAQQILDGLQNETVESTIRVKTEQAMFSFWSEFKNRFRYIGWKGTVLAKLKTETEFRSGVTFEHENVIYGIPGKVSNIFNFEDEVLGLIASKDCIQRNGVRFVSGGILDSAYAEIASKPKPGVPNTCNLDTLASLSIFTHTDGEDEKRGLGCISHY